MNKKEAAVIKLLAELGLAKESKLSDEEADMLSRALDPEKEFLHAVEKLFNGDKKTPHDK